MASPIIKIKRGAGAPTPAGITAGEFAFDRVAAVLYLGISGGGYDPSTGNVNNDTTPLVIPVGMQVSNDETFGGIGVALNAKLGYSDNTIPTTSAVKEYVNAQFAQTALGVTFRAGSGIGITFVFNDPEIDVTITNLGTVKAYGKYDFYGSQSGFSTISPGSTSDTLRLYAEKGIHLLAEKSGGNDQIKFFNTGVREIAGYTGDITSITPISSLSGFTVAVGLAVLDRVSNVSPINFVPDVGAGKLQISHSTSGVASGNYPAYVAPDYYIPTIEVNETGHIQSLTPVKLDLTTIKPAGFTEAVQDAAFGSIIGSDGITFTYNDAGNVLNATLTGIKSLNAFGAAGPGICGHAVLYGVNGIQVDKFSGAQGYPDGVIRIQNTTNTFGSVFATTISGSGIYGPGKLGVGNQTINADSTTDTLRFYAGRGIGLCGSNDNPNPSTDGMLIWNAGINTIQFKDNGGSDIGAGMSGDIIIQASTGVSISRPDINGQIISISSSGSGAGIGSLQADYDVAQTDLQSGNVYAGDGVTGNIEIIGRNGIVTKQTVGANTLDGDLFIGLSSQLILPIGEIDYDSTDSTGYGKIIVPTAQEMTDNSSDSFGGYSGLVGQQWYNFESAPSNRSAVNVDSIRGGLTGTLSHGTVGTDAPYTILNVPGNWDAGNYQKQPGKILTLWADAGLIGVGSSTTGNQAQINLMGWPHAENLGAELDLSIVPAIEPGAPPAAPCGDGCVGFPPVLPNCATGFVGTPGEVDFEWQYDTNLQTGSATRPTIKMNGNVILKDSIFVDKDIWIKGNILDAETGCLYSGGNGSGGPANTCIECLGNGNVGITGSAYVTNSIFVRGASAYFNVDDFAVKDNVIRLGSSGGLPLEGTDSNERGFVIFNYGTVVGTPLAAAVNITNKTSFVGIKRNGIFTYIPQATLDNTGGYDNYTGTIGPAQFASYNGVGFTANSGGGANIKTGPAGTLNTDINVSGLIDIVGPSNSQSRSTVNFKQGSIVDIGNTSKLILNSSNSPIVDFVRGVTFDTASAVYSGAAGAAGNQLTLKWKSTNNDSTRFVSIRNNGDNTYTQLVDVGRKYTGSTDPGAVSLDTLSATVSEGDIQVLYNKHLADGTVIDCGTY